MFTCALDHTPPMSFAILSMIQVAAGANEKKSSSQKNPFSSFWSLVGRARKSPPRSTMTALVVWALAHLVHLVYLPSRIKLIIWARARVPIQ